MKSKSDFTKEKLRPKVLELANLAGYENPSTYLNELLEEVKEFNSFEFEQVFFLNIHYLCKENAGKFWSESHRKDISRWLGKARILTDVFKTTWKCNNLTPQQTETKTGQGTIEMKPVLKPEAVESVFNILKDFFSPEHQTELKNVLEKGNNASNKLLFKDNGNRLTDTFKKLIEDDFITCSKKEDLINWIISNFTFTHQKKEKAFVYGTVEKTISRKGYPCKRPLIEIKDGQIQKVEHSNRRKYSKY